MKENGFKILMISAMYENGGNTTQRLLDGEPGLAVYPFESQLGSKYVNDFLNGMFPHKYRWPVFPSFSSAEQLYEMIIDEECKVRIKTPNVSKFRSYPFELTDSDRKKRFVALMRNRTSVDSGAAITAFFQATFDTWKNCMFQRPFRAYVGYSPIIIVDAQKMIRDFGSNISILHIVRNPFSAYADTKKRPVPLSLEHYMSAWVTCQYFARAYATLYPKQVSILRFEDIIADPQKTLGTILKKLQVQPKKILTYPSFNGQELKEMYPWGTIRVPTISANNATAKELTHTERRAIQIYAEPYLASFGYTAFTK